MKKSSDQRSKQKDAEDKTNYSKCLARDTKLSSFLGGNPSRNFHVFCFLFSLIYSIEF